MPAPQFYDGEALVSWSETDVTIAVPWYLGLMFRTRQPGGTLMQANAGRSSTINLMVSRFSEDLVEYSDTFMCVSKAIYSEYRHRHVTSS